MDDKIKSFLDLAIKFADASKKLRGFHDERMNDDAIREGYLYAKYKEQGFDAIMQVGMQERDGYCENWYALRGTPEELAIFYHRHMVEVDFDESDDVSYHVHKTIDLRRPIEGYNGPSPLFLAISDEKIQAKAAQGSDVVPGAQFTMCRGLKEMDEDGASPAQPLQHKIA